MGKCNHVDHETKLSDYYDYFSINVKSNINKTKHGGLKCAVLKD